MTRLLAFLLIVVGLAVVVAPTSRGALAQQATGCGAQPWAEAQVAGGPLLSLELARTPQEHERGLMFRQAVPPDEGMLFIFGHRTGSAFWMRNTLVPLSVAYIDQDGTILDLQDMQPLDETPHPPARPYWYALEVNQGWFRDNGVGVGDVMAFCLQTAEES